jgi:drug/metabolite transporter (DMT)-like permease
LPVIIILLFTNELQGFLQYSPFEWVIVLILACFSTGFGLFIFFLGVRKLDISQGMSMALLKPIMAAIIAFFILMRCRLSLWSYLLSWYRSQLY